MKTMNGSELRFLKTLAISWISLLFLAARHSFAEINPDSVELKVVNHAGSPIEIFWINTFDPPHDEIVKQTTKPVRNGTDTLLMSFDTHQFVVKFQDPKRNQYSASFTKGPKPENVIVSFDKDADSLSVVQRTKFDEIMDSITLHAKKCDALSGPSFRDCLANSVVKDIENVIDYRTRAETYLQRLSARLRNYTCVDDNIEYSKPVSSYISELENGVQYTVDMLLDLPSSKIWSIDNFITDEECDILIRHGRPRLTRAAVHGEDGKSTYSDSRKAQQAVYSIIDKWDEDPLWDLNQRILSIVNGHANYDLTYPGQEDFTIIQYNVDDQYIPHCDGSCDGSRFNPGGRVATALMYCMEPEKGGSTTFTKADIIVKPTKGSAVFFAYRGPDGIMDEGGYTEHSGCPVLKGEKWVITFWMRDGVSFEEPWNTFDASGIRVDHNDGNESGLSSEGDVMDEL